MSNLPELQVTVFSDYICPFCYVGHHRLMRLKDSYDIKVNWCLLEIHPENLEQGEPVASLDYSSKQRRRCPPRRRGPDIAGRGQDQPAFSGRNAAIDPGPGTGGLKTE